MKYILVTGGVISGIGKGVISSSIGTILNCSGLTVTSIKIDPYINIDAGTFNPYEHGEVFVLDDGGEVDLDLGNYERFLDITLSRDNNITTGKIYQNVISKERRGDFLGKTVQVVPHVTDTIMNWVERVAHQPVSESGKTPDVCVIELGGTIGDIEGMQFVEAFRQFQFKVGRENFCLVHVSLIVETNSGEQKTKPTQQNVRELRALGLSPDFIACRSKSLISEDVRSKISMFCHVPLDHVINVYDVTNLYRVPILLHQTMLPLIFQQLKIAPSITNGRRMRKWHDLAETSDRILDPVNICLVGKYTKLSDAYASVIKALQHAALFVNRKLQLSMIESEDLEDELQNSDPMRFHAAWHALCSAQGVIVPGGFGHRGTEGKMLALRWCREKKVPLLGVCLGFQLAVIEFARNGCGLADAKSGESEAPSENVVVIDMPHHNQGNLGGTMLLGAKRFKFTEDCTLKSLYWDCDSAKERHRHRYEVNPEYVPALTSAGMRFVATNPDGTRMECFDMPDHPYYVGVQFHPEYLTRPLKPSPPYLGLLLACTGQLDKYISLPLEGRKKWRCSYNNHPHSDSFDAEEDQVSTELSDVKISE